MESEYVPWKANLSHEGKCQPYKAHIQGKANLFVGEFVLWNSNI